MMNLYGAPGMGAAGTGWGAMPQVPGNGMSPQLMQLMQSLQQGGGGMAGGGGAMPPPGPLQAPPTGTPMANFIGAGGMPGAGMQHPMAAPMPAGAPSLPAGATTGSPNSQPMGALNPQMLAMLQALKGQQTGVAPGGGATPAGATPPPQMAPGMGGGTGPMAPGVDAFLRSLGMFGAPTGGAPT